MTREQENAAAEMIGALFGAATRVRSVAQQAPPNIARALDATARLIEMQASESMRVFGFEDHGK